MAIRWVCLKKSYSRTLGCLSVNPPLPPTLVAIQWLVCGFNLSKKWESVRIISQINMVEFLEIPNIPIYIYSHYMPIFSSWIPMISSLTNPSAWRISRSSLVHSPNRPMRLSAPSLGRGTASTKALQLRPFRGGGKRAVAKVKPSSSAVGLS